VGVSEMKIDTHQHYWKYRSDQFPWITDGMPALQQDCMPADCEGALRKAGVQGVLAVQARCCTEETDFLLQIAHLNPEILGVVGWANLMLPGLERQLDAWCQNPALKGFRHILQDEPDVAAWVAAPGVGSGLKTLQKRRLVYDVLVFDHQLALVLDLCARHSDHWLVLDHLGKPALRHWANDGNVAARWRDNLHRIAQLPHVMCKLSGLVTETGWSDGQGLSASDEKNILSCFDYALSVFGPDRLMFGSDWPVCQLAAPYESVHMLAQTWASITLTQAEQSAFWSGNAIRCYGLSPSLTAD
jgi:L-fuconolactonase